MQHAGFAHERLGNSKGLRDSGQFVIEYTGKREQGVTLVLQRSPHWVNASGGYCSMHFP